MYCYGYQDLTFSQSVALEYIIVEIAGSPFKIEESGKYYIGLQNENKEEPSIERTVLYAHRRESDVIYDQVG